MTIVLLGYTGLIGKSILAKLVKDTSLNIICVGRNRKKKPYTNPQVKYERWDFVNFSETNLTFLKKAKVIINCVGKTNNSSNSLEKINVTFVKKLIEYININKFKVRLIHLSSVAVYGGGTNYFRKKKIILENSPIKQSSLYSKSKYRADLLIKSVVKNNLNKKFSYTILRISNAYSKDMRSNLFKYLILTLKIRIWIRYSKDTYFNFIGIEDVAQAVILSISKLTVSKNKTYIVSDDCKQYNFYENYRNIFKKTILEIGVPDSLLKLLFYISPLSKKIKSFVTIISSKVTYSNRKIKKELDFKPENSLIQKIIQVDEQKI